MTCDDGNPCPDLGQAQKCGRVKLVNVIPPPLLDNWISNGNTNINKQNNKKACTDLLPIKKMIVFIYSLKQAVYLCCE
jgi:hypothetical protein